MMPGPENGLKLETAGLLGSKPYSSGAIAAIASQVGSGFAGLASLFFLTQILSKEDFGGYAFSVNLLILLSIVATLGLDRTLLLGIAGLNRDGSLLQGGALFRGTMHLAGAAALFLALLIWVFSGYIESAIGFSTAQWWIGALSIAIVPLTLSTLIRSWYQANHRVAASAAMPGVSDIVRAGLIGAVFFLEMGRQAVAAAFIVSAMVPFVVLLIMARGKTSFGENTLLAQDVPRGLAFVLQRISDSGMNLIDIVVVGLVASDVVTAEYAIAARLAALCDLGRIAVVPTFTPRVRRHVTDRDQVKLTKEYRMARLTALAVALAASAVLALFGRPVLLFFGDFGDAFGPMMVLAAGYVVGSGAGLHGIYLAMTGEVRLSALIRSVGLVTSIVSLAVLTPVFGAIGSAFAVLFVLALVNGASLAVLWWRTGSAGMSVSGLALVVVCSALLCAAGLDLIGGPIVATALFTALAVVMGPEFWHRLHAMPPSSRDKP